MAADPFAFFRGSAAVTAADLGGLHNTGLTVQLCGDAHLSNSGIYASPERTCCSTSTTSTRRSPGRSNGM
jgi:uncharacterized protein (DUF2252 family)